MRMNLSTDKHTLVIKGLTTQEVKEVLAKVREIERGHPDDLIFAHIGGVEDKPVEEALQVLREVFPRLEDEEPTFRTYVKREIMEELVEEIFEGEVQVVRAVCLNVLRELLYGEKLQAVVIYHLKNFKRNLLNALKETT